MLRRLVLFSVFSRTMSRSSSTVSSSSAFVTQFLREEDFEMRRSLIQQEYLCEEDGHMPLLPSLDILHHTLVHSPDGIRFSMKLIKDVLQVCRQLKKSSISGETTTTNTSPWKELDKFLMKFLSSVFCHQALSLKRITFESSAGNILERVARGEAVHSVRSLSELKRRLHNGRRCFGLFHHSLPDEPLAFVHIALTDKLTKSVKDIDRVVELD